MPCHLPHFISSCRYFIISHPHQSMKKSHQSILIERSQSYNFYQKFYFILLNNFISLKLSYNSSILLAIVINLLLCQIYKLNTYLHRCINIGKNSIYRVQQHPEFPVPLIVLNLSYPHGQGGTYCTKICLCVPCAVNRKGFFPCIYCQEKSKMMWYLYV